MVRRKLLKPTSVLLLFTLVFSFFPVPLPQANAFGTGSDVLTVEEAITHNSGTSTVEGYIVAHTIAPNRYDFDAPFGNDYNFALADSASERDPSKILPIQIPSHFRSNFGLQSNPDLIGKKIHVTGNLEAYFGVPGLKSPSHMELVDHDSGGSEPITGLRIHDIQGAAHISPYKGEPVAGIEGIVTKLDGTNGFYIQDPKPDDDIRTSEAIYVYKRNANVKVGDLVKVDGTVDEYGYDGELKKTEIVGQRIEKVSSGNDLPDPVLIGKGGRVQPTEIIDDDGMSAFEPETDGIDFYESLEGMLIQLENAEVVAPPKYGEIAVVVDNGADQLRTPAGGVLINPDDYNPERILVDAEGVNAKVGDTFDGTIVGVVGYDYSNFKLHPTQSLPEVTDGGTEQAVTTIVPRDDALTVASYNVENYSAKTDPEKTAKIATSIVENLKTPDIIGLIEVQDNNGPTDDGTTDASESYQTLIDAISAEGGPTYAFTDIAPENKQDGGQPGGNIRVGFLYNPDRVSLTDKPKGDATTPVGVDEKGLTLNPGRIDPTNEAFTDSRKPLAAEFEFNGEQIIVIANHLNSKGGDDALFGENQPPVLNSEAQRIDQARAINTFVKDIVTAKEDANVVVLGDLNDFEFSRPLEVLAGDELTNLITTLPENERYTYNYEGNSQVLDHILVSHNLAGQAEADIVNINADFSTADGRASDHDPVLAQLRVGGEAGNETFELTVMHTNDTHAHLDNVARRITAIENVRAEAENTILLDAGDVFSGTLFFNQYLGLADLEFMNMAGYDAMTPGNHEFDKDSATLANFVRGAEFPIVSANIDYGEDRDLGPLYKDEIGKPGEGGHLYPAIITEVDGEEVGIFGLTTEDTAFLANPADTIVFEDRIEKARETVNMLQKEGVNKIIALTHIGHKEDLALAEAVEGIDIVVGGHSHTLVEAPVVLNEDSEPTVVVQADEYSHYLGTLKVVFDDAGVLQQWDGELIDLNEQDADGNYVIEEDPEAAARLAELAEPIEELKNQVVGETSVFLNGEREDVRTKETNLGNLIADGMLSKAQDSVNATIAITNGGGIRASIDEGEISLGEVLTTMPFGNTLVTLDLNGEEIVQSLEHGVGGVENKEGRFPHVAGLKFEYNPSLPPGERIVEVNVRNEDGFEPIDPNNMYTVATNAFMANGGDGYEIFGKAKAEGRIDELGFVDYEVFVEYLEKQGTVSPEVEGRIVETDRVPGEGGDTAAPVTNIILPQADLSDGSYLHELTFELEASDDGSGVKKIEYSLDRGETWQTYERPVTVTKNGETVIQYRATDNAGNVEETKSAAVVVKTATLKNVKTFVKDMKAHIGVKISTQAHLLVAERHFDRGRDPLGYLQLKLVSKVVSRYNDRLIHPDDRRDLTAMLDYIVEHRTVE